jgi:hypothetical protein
VPRPGRSRLTYAYSAVHCDTVPPNGLIGISGQAGHHTWAYDEADDYTFSLAATAGAGTLALSLYAGSGWANLLLNTHSRAATVDRASRARRAIPYAQTLEISPGGAAPYACISSGQKGELAAYSAATGKLTPGAAPLDAATGHVLLLPGLRRRDRKNPARQLLLKPFATHKPDRHQPAIRNDS